ncbi:hypothetical protein BJ875DRAFT_377537 [Amylocarpus encephaloides]|uniref:C2H2-type domain-containing protein n=1 Tax=Amylocarpus encephaloides TaxID=45428 RepID=A0A9P8C6E0_9HELO|nr:hypothetical protein BJ875DRAFT_377537 [Amylocarpus encephaloides]
MANNLGTASVANGGPAAGAVVNGPRNDNATIFESILNEFKSGLKKKHRDEFQVATLQQLQQQIGEIQNKQQSERRMQNMARLGRFIEAIEEYGKVIEVFCNSSQFVPFIWVTSNFHRAFSELLGVYERIGENIPLLTQYQDLFPDNARMAKVLGYMYQDILEFHQKALRYFQQPMWGKLFDATWKNFKSDFAGPIANMETHRRLIESQASLSEIEVSRKIQLDELKRDAARVEFQEDSRRATVKNWLKPASFETDHESYSRIRAEYPNTGKWLLANENFKLWFDPYPAIPPLLWLNGMPGAGNSLVVDEARGLNHQPTVLYFYCKSGDSQRGNFVAIARGLLSQLLYQKRELLEYLHKEASISPEALLSSPKVAMELLKMAIQNCVSVYIILDGIDECPREERKFIASWFRNLVEELPPSNAESIRCLFVSQDDGFARKDFAGLSTISIRSKDNKLDIEEYSTIWAAKIKDRLKISDKTATKIITTISNTVEGMFLLAELICNNLFHQTSIHGVEVELQPDRFPNKVNKAYSRILARIMGESSEAELKDTMLLLGWLVCAKRPLKWHEIQGAKAINLDDSAIEWDQRKLQVGSKDLCGSLVKIREDQTVELVHLTAKFFLIEEHHASISVGEIRMANLCVDYLKLPGFEKDKDDYKIEIFSGYYAFMDYAIAYWVRHLEAGLVGIEEDEEEFPRELMSEYTESLGCFIEKHWASPTAPLDVSPRNSDRLELLHDAPFYVDLEQAVVSTRKQLTWYGKMKEEEIALYLPEILVQVRKAFEAVLPLIKDISRDRFKEMYGVNLYKCSRFSCSYFSNGFPTSEERDEHTKKHDRPYRCTVEGCLMALLGLATAKGLDKHMKDNHGTVADLDEEFPVEIQVARPRAAERLTIEPTISRKEIHRCNACFKVFKRKYNLQSHLVIHDPMKPFGCSTCPKRFARLSDCTRHEKSHSGIKFTCTGVLRDGSSWGCGKEFARADTLSNHHKTRLGQQCILPYLQEKELKLSFRSAR